MAKVSKSHPQATGGHAMGGPGLSTGTAGIKVRKAASIGKSGAVSPNSANRGKNLKRP